MMETLYGFARLIFARLIKEGGLAYFPSSPSPNPNSKGTLRSNYCLGICRQLDCATNSI